VFPKKKKRKSVSAADFKRNNSLARDYLQKKGKPHADMAARCHQLLSVFFP